MMNFTAVCVVSGVNNSSDPVITQQERIQNPGNDFALFFNFILLS